MPSVLDFPGCTDRREVSTTSIIGDEVNGMLNSIIIVDCDTLQTKILIGSWGSITAGYGVGQRGH